MFQHIFERLLVDIKNILFEIQNRYHIKMDQKSILYYDWLIPILWLAEIQLSRKHKQVQLHLTYEVNFSHLD